MDDIESDLVDRALKRLFDHLLPGGVLVAYIMTLWKNDEPLVAEWEATATRAKDGVKFRRVSRTRYDLERECEHTGDR